MDFVVKRDDLRAGEFVSGEEDGRDLEPGQAQLRIQKFGLTANNVTYAVYGDTIGYWRFFPAKQGWGRVPVWGFGEVVNSAVDSIPRGGRYYGFFPISSYVTMLAKPNSTGFRDVAPHRLELPGAYNQYLLTTADPVYDPIHENEQMILRPLFITSFLAYDFLAAKEFFGAKTVVLSSASSKTAYGLAFLLAREPSLEVIGLTSPRNREFTAGLGCYDRVFTYREIEQLPVDRPVTFIDVAGSVSVLNALHQYLGDQLSYSMALGDTHWQEEKAGLTGSQEFFFAPAWLTGRVEEWGMPGFVDRLAQAWHAASGSLSAWMKIVEEAGPDAIRRVFLDHVEGRADPRIGNVLSLDY